MKLFRNYLRDRLFTKLFFFLIIVVYSFYLVLYQLPIEAVLYPLILSLLIGSLFVIYDFYKYKNKIKSLSALKHDISLLIIPREKNNLERRYLDIINELDSKIINLENQKQEEIDQLIDYYSLWVHQIKIPIASMKLSLENMDSKEARDLLIDLNRIEHYTSMVLTYLRLQSLSTDYVFSNQNVKPIILDNIRKFTTEFINKKISLELNDEDLMALIDKKWFDFIIEQILSNALKYTPTGKITIFVKKPDTIIIEDTGIGISKEDLPRIFEKGFTGFNGREETKSTGIGLYLVDKVCKNQNISIDYSSELNKGTKVVLKLPQEKIWLD